MDIDQIVEDLNPHEREETLAKTVISATRHPKTAVRVALFREPRFKNLTKTVVSAARASDTLSKI